MHSLPRSGEFFRERDMISLGMLKYLQDNMNHLPIRTYLEFRAALHIFLGAMIEKGKEVDNNSTQSNKD